MNSLVRGGPVEHLSKNGAAVTGSDLPISLAMVDAERGEHHRCRYADRSDGSLSAILSLRAQLEAGEHHAESGTDDNRIELLEPRRGRPWHCVLSPSPR